MKNFIKSLLCTTVAVSAIILSSCGASPENVTNGGADTTASLTDRSNTAVTGRVLATDGSYIALQLGEYDENAANTAPQLPDGQLPDGQPPFPQDGGEQDGQPSDSGMQPGMPNGDGDFGRGGEDKPDNGDGKFGKNGEFDKDFDFKGGKDNGGRMLGISSDFTANGEFAIIDISGAELEIKSTTGEKNTDNEIYVGDLVTVKFGSDNKAEKVTVMADSYINLGDMLKMIGGGAQPDMQK